LLNVGDKDDVINSEEGYKEFVEFIGQAVKRDVGEIKIKWRGPNKIYNNENLPAQISGGKYDYISITEANRNVRAKSETVRCRVTYKQVFRLEKF
jgi:hypothetical protein